MYFVAIVFSILFSVLENLFYFHQELVFLSPAHFYFSIVTHDDHTPFPALIFFYVMKIDEVGFMDPKEGSILKYFIPKG